MNSRSRYAADIIVNFTAAAMKPHGGETPGSIRPRRHAHYGLRHIPCRSAKAMGLLMPAKLLPMTRRIESSDGDQRTTLPNAPQKKRLKHFRFNYWSLSAKTD
jgi:hypothetical protein